MTNAVPATGPEAAAFEARPLMRLDRVDVRYGAHRALSDVSLALGRGERLALIGANGSGKSSLLRVMGALLAPSAGRMDGAPGLRRAMLFQRPFLLRASALFNVTLAARLAGARPWVTARTRASSAIEQVGLSSEAARRADRLSVGQQQRLALARALVRRPDLLLLDEPTASLDPHGKREVEALIESLAAGGQTLVFASHNLGQVKRLASRVIYLEDGRVRVDAPVDRFFDRGALPLLSPAADAFVRGE